MATAAVIGGSALVGAYASDRASKRSAGAIKDAANTASSTQLQMFDRMTELQAPWREVGMQALNEQAAMLGLSDSDFIPLEDTPGYQYEVNAMRKAQAARGMLGSGQGIRDEGRLASDHFQRRLMQLGALSGMGGGVAQNIGQMGMNTAGNVGNLQMLAGQAGANRAIQQGNIISNLINQGSQAYAMNNFNKPQSAIQSYASPGYVPPGGSFGVNPTLGAEGTGFAYL